jgi:putative SOS response-associated peptidase YedK
VRPDRQPFLFAGLWERWRNPDDATAEPLETFTLLTTTPNGVAAPIHDRMPVILDGEARKQWLDETTTPEVLAGLLRPYPDEYLTRYAVPALVGSPKNDVPECIVPLPAGG